MRIVVAIPHYVGSGASLKARHSSTAAAPEERAAKLGRTVLALHQAFGPRQTLMQLWRREATAANAALRASELKILVCTAGQQHALASSGLTPSTMEHHSVSIEPPWLGYACRELLADHADTADWCCYLEDDLLMEDGLLFAKLAWFLDVAGADAVLQPNRFERSAGPLAHRAYVDGDLREPTAGRFQDRRDRPEITAELFGRTWRFIRPSNPHSGCYFLRGDQMRHWMRQPDFSLRSAEFVGPLESAASLGLMRHFRVYKPALENAAFFEIEHQSQQFISQLRPKPT